MRILVAAASRHGSTSEIANELAKELRRALPDAGVDVVPLTPGVDLDGYQAAVLGSGVYFGRWLAEARDAIDAHADALRQRPVWLFSSGPVGHSSVPGSEPADAVEIAERIDARDHVVFSGALHREALGLRERAVVGLVRSADGDFRDWPAVRAWTDHIAAALTAPAGTTP
jgi:menaquinone-dependent protoporphyrinogen oxidase